MGFLQVRKCISFLPAGFVIYFLLQYLVYQPELQQRSRAHFVESAAKGKRSSIIYSSIEKTSYDQPNEGVVEENANGGSSPVETKSQTLNSGSDVDPTLLSEEKTDLQNTPRHHPQDLVVQNAQSDYYPQTGSNEVQQSHPDLKRNLFAHKEALLDMINSGPLNQPDKVVEMEEFPVEVANKPPLLESRNQFYVLLTPEEQEPQANVDSFQNVNPQIGRSQQSVSEADRKSADYFQMGAKGGGEDGNPPSLSSQDESPRQFIGAPRELLSNEDDPNNMPNSLSNESEPQAGAEKANEETPSRDLKAFLPTIEVRGPSADSPAKETPSQSPARDAVAMETPVKTDQGKEVLPMHEGEPMQPAPVQASAPQEEKGGLPNAPPPLQPNEPPKNDPPKKTQIIKKIAPSLAINNLKGKIKVGQLFEPGFQNPQMEICPNNGRYLKVLMLVTTAPDHERQRNAVRQTWGHFSMRKDIAMGFMVGRTFKPEIQTLIDRENERYGDIIEAKFIDHYSNLTLKTMAMLEWSKTYCSEARFILKTDDDMFINVPLLLAFIHTKQNERRSIFGRLAKGWKPVRNKKSKYYIEVATYNRVRYPEFLTGPAYLLTNDVVDEIYQKALDTTFFVLEDVLVTGFVSESLQVKRVGDSHFRNEKIKLVDTCKLMQSISIHMVTYEEQFDIYKRTLDGKTKCKIR